MNKHEQESGRSRRPLLKINGRAIQAWLASHILHHIDVRIMRWSRGRATLSSWLSGQPLLELTTTGARSGKQRSVILIGIPVKGGILLVASNWGQDRHPGWYHNVKAHPTVSVTMQKKQACYHARELVGQEYTSYWQEAIRFNSVYAAYQERAGNRKIPLILLTPIE